MPRKLRYVPPGGALVEITCRTFQARYFLRPTPESTELILGIVGRAQRLHDMKICSLVVLSNHLHFLLWVRDAKQLADFMAFVNVNLSKEIGTLVGWSGSFWHRRYDAILVSNEEKAQVARLAYQLRHGSKEDLVDHPAQWPGVHAIRAWCAEEPLEGYWFDRSKEGAARRRGRKFDRLKFATKEVVTLSPLPCWEAEGLGMAEAREEVRRLVATIVEEEKARRRSDGVEPKGARSLLAIPPTFRPAEPESSRAPLFHAATRAEHERFRRAYGTFVLAYRSASRALREGETGVVFPLGSFPPALPFVVANGTSTEDRMPEDGVPGTSSHHSADDPRST